jgi:SNF2 family DNA or RNA helicase
VGGAHILNFPEKLAYAFKTKPYAYQLDMLKFGENELRAGNPGFAWFAEQGTGKTKVTIDFANALFKADFIDMVFLVAPNGVHAQWATEQIPTHSAAPYAPFVFETPLNKADAHFFKQQQEGKAAVGFDGKVLNKYIKWFCVNVEAFSRDTYINEFRAILKNNRCLFVIDEATRIKNPEAERTHRIMYDINEVTRDRNRRITSIIRLSTFRIILTGTPITSSPFDVWAPVEFLRPGFWKLNFHAFKHRYGIMVRDTNRSTGKPFSRKLGPAELARIRDMLDKKEPTGKIAYTFNISEMDIQYIANHPEIIQPYKNMDELRDRLRTVGMFVRKEDVLDLPPKVYSRRILPLTSEQKKMIRSLTDDFIAEFGEQFITVNNALSLTTRLHQISGGLFPLPKGGTEENNYVYLEHTPNKLNALIEDVAEHERPLIVTTRFRGEARLIAERLSESYGVENAIRLLMSEDPDREDVITAFKKKEIDILITTEQVISIGYNLQSAHTMLLYSTGLNFETRAQLEDRFHRVGQTESCLYVDYAHENSYDLVALQNQKNKKDLLDFVRAGGVKGVQFIRELLNTKSA